MKPASLVPLPIIEEPFFRAAMDVVGPLPHNWSGNRFILVICDYGTRYPEAIPCRLVGAEHVAEELVKLFTRVRVPAEILMDQGSNFMSQLLMEVYHLLHIEPIRTSPYHPQTDGLVERLNQTSKQCSRKPLHRMVRIGFISVSSESGMSQVRHTWPWRMEPTGMVKYQPTPEGLGRWAGNISD